MATKRRALETADDSGNDSAIDSSDVRYRNSQKFIVPLWGMDRFLIHLCDANYARSELDKQKIAFEN